MNNVSAHKMVKHLQKIQFVCEYFLLSKVSETHKSVSEMLMIIESFKFYFKCVSLTECKGIYIESAEKKIKPQIEIEDLEDKTTIDEEIDREKRLLEIIKDRPLESIGEFATIFSSSEEIIIGSSKSEKKYQGKNNYLKFQDILGEILTMLRPLVSIISIRLFGTHSYKPYIFSLVVDILIMFYLQKNIKVKTEEEKKELLKRKKEFILRYIFKKPFFLILKQFLIEPLLAKILKPERSLSRIALYVLEMQSSISLTL